MRSAFVIAAALLCAATQSFAAGATYFRLSESTIVLPVSNNDTIIVSVKVPAGTWAIHANAEVQNGIDGNNFTNCDILVQGESVSAMEVSSGLNPGFTYVASLAMSAAVETKRKSTTIALGCRQQGSTVNDKIGQGATLLVATTPELK